MATATAAPVAREHDMTLGQAASALGLKDWQLVRLFTRGFAEEPARLGRFRVIRADDLPRLREAALRAGYLPQAPAANGETPAA
jgi:hypothetical protein